MKKLLIIIKASVILFLFAANTFGINNHNNLEKTSLCFTENKGQVRDQFYKPRPDVLFSGESSNMNFYLKKNGISYQQYNPLSWQEEYNPFTKEKEKNVKEVGIYRTDIEWVNCNTNSKISTKSVLPGVNNYYLENCEQGVTDVLSYEELYFTDIYKGIDLRWYGTQDGLKYDFIVKPLANFKQIKIEVKGAKRIYINTSGQLIIKTPFGEIIEEAPIVKQDGKIISSKWQIENGLVCFSIADYNKNLELIIDPGVRQWGTYYGGSGGESFYCKTFDSAGNIIGSGSTNTASSINIATVGTHQTTFGGGTRDAFVVKFNSAGVRQWGTYYGGSGQDWGSACAADATGNIFFGGWTWSATGTVIVTGGCHQPFIGGVDDGFLVKLNSSGIRVWGTYYGGTGSEFISSCSVDASGNVYATGSTASTGAGTIVASAGSHQPFYGGANDGFLVKFNNNGVRQWATYYGGSLSDIVSSCVINSAGDVFIVGGTNSTIAGAISTVGSYQINNGGARDAFLAKFNSSGVRQWGTFYGGAGTDEAYSVGIDLTGNVFIHGETSTTVSAVMSSGGAHQTIFGGGTRDAFLAKFDNLGNRIWGTFYGGNGNEDTDYTRSCYSDGSNIYICGATTTSLGTSIATSLSHQPLFGGNVSDAYLAKLDANGVRLWGTYYGGTLDDYGIAALADGVGNVYLSGETISTNGTVIATAGSHKPTFSGTSDGFLAKFYECPGTPGAPIDVTPMALLNICSGQTTTLNANGSGTISWYNSPTSTLVLSTGSVYSTPTLTTGLTTSTYSFFAEAYTCTNSPRTSFVVTVNPIPTLTVSSNATICAGNNVTLTALGASSYTWNPGSFSGSSYISTPSVSTIYSVTGVTGICQDTKTISVTVSTLNLTTSTPSSNICNGTTTTLTATGANTYTWQPLNLTGPTLLLTPSNTITYSVTGTNTFGCASTKTIQIVVNPNPTVTASASNTNICSAGSATLSGTGATFYNWQPGNLSGSNQTVTPLSSIVYTVIGSYASGCTDTKTTSILVFQNPTVNITPTSTFICVGNTTTLTANGANTYSWSTGSTTQSIALSPTTNTIITVIGTNTNNCSNTKTISLAVNINTVSVNVSANTTIVCIGNQATLNASGAATYSWAGGPNTQNYIVSPTVNTTYSVTGYDVSNCSNTKTISVNVTTNTVVIAANSSTPNVCSGSTVILNASGANTYSWSSGASTQSTIVTPTASSTYTVIGTNTAFCSSTQTVFIGVYSLPNLIISTSNSLLCSGQSATLNASGANSYTWSTSSNSSGIIVNPVATTNYTVNGTNINGCNNYAIITQSVSLCTYSEQFSNTNKDDFFHLYPNPTNGRLTIEYGAPNFTIRIVDLLGKVISESIILNNNVIIDLTNYANGVYFISLKSEGRNETHKIIKN